MHLSIPDSEEVTDPGTTVPYVSYNVHINGTFHCSARFSAFEKLHDRLKRDFGAGCLEKFPSKSLFYLKPAEAGYRRYELQRWLQRIGSQPLIVQGEAFQSFLLNAQKEVAKGAEEEVQLEVFLVNGKSVKVDILSTDQSDDVLETTCQVLDLAPALTYYFGLYLVTDLSGKVVVRRLQDFESPYISLMRADPDNKIMLRKSYWEPKLDQVLYSCPIALNLLYIQTIADIKNGFVAVADNVADDLANFRAQKDRASFLGVARRMKGYGSEQFGNATCNVPKDGSTVGTSLNNDAFTLTEAGGKEHFFYIPRIRCWRTYTVEDGKVELEFEYYFDPAAGQTEGRMGWVKIVSPHTIHMAMCLQQLVEELMRVKRAQAIKKPSDRVGKFKPRRQSAKPADLTFLTSDATDAGATSPLQDGGSAASSPTKKVAVTLSDLISIVKGKDADATDPASGRGKTKPPKDDPDDYDSDEDDARALATMAGL